MSFDYTDVLCSQSAKLVVDRHVRMYIWCFVRMVPGCIIQSTNPGCCVLKGGRSVVETRAEGPRKTRFVQKINWIYIILEDAKNPANFLPLLHRYFHRARAFVI